MYGNHTAEGDYIEQAHDDRDYCEHGTFIGNPLGGDYLCHWCELGVPAKTLEEEIADCETYELIVWKSQLTDSFDGDPENGPGTPTEEDIREMTLINKELEVRGVKF